MSTRTDLESDLAKAEADLAHAAANLASACTDPAEAEAELAKTRTTCHIAHLALARLNRSEAMPIGYRSGHMRTAPGAESEKTHADRRKASEDRRRGGVAPTSARTTRQVDGVLRRKTYDDRRLVRPVLPNRTYEELPVKLDGRTDELIKGVASGPKELISKGPRSTQPGEHVDRAVKGSSARSPGEQKENPGVNNPVPAKDSDTRNTRAWRSLAWQAIQLSSLALAYLQYYFIDVNLQIAKLPSPIHAVLLGN